MFDKIVQKMGNKFYSVNEEIITIVEEELGIILPSELKEFYMQVGYGFLSSDNYNFNRIMSPRSLCDFRFRKGQFNNNSELEIYDDIERDKIIFFEISEGSYLAIGFSKSNNGNIFYGNTMIANDLKEFLKRYQEDENYFD